MTITSERAGSLVISKEEDDVGLLGSMHRASQQETNGADEFFHFCFSISRGKRYLRTMIESRGDDNQ
jgi:hypothetical protein